MNLKQLKPRKALNKAFLKLKPNRSEIEIFKTNLIQLLDRIDEEESEEFHKFLLVDFLKKTYYEPNHYINTKGRNDLVIHNGNKASSTVGVIVETKKPTNRSEMLTQEKINVKAFQELVLYYLRERITHKNLEIKYLIATNINEWFVFDSNIFEKYFAHNKSFIKQFNDFEEGRLSGKTTDFFYNEIAEPFINGITQEIEFTYFDIREYEKPLRNNDKKDDNKLIALYKLLSPEHLLKLPFANDSNTLDKRFYSELLHIIGLVETKEGSKKIIGRNKEGSQNFGSILENAIIELDSLDKISRLEKPSQFGSNMQEKLFNVALELSITWINRILFLKLLEAQLIKYQKGNEAYNFLSFDKVQNYDDLNSLFFKVLARKHDERVESVKSAFEKVPYLNSSLFEPSDLEHTTLLISNLRDEKELPIYSATVLKDNQGRKRTGKLNTLEYLFEFLDAYDFTSEGSEEIQEDNKTLINASVLGLIFEKINGYKDGSFFTPGFITMYMCRETIRKAVVQKFNESKNWKCKTIDELYDKIEDRKEANDIINRLKICDPAVGSGHFLVSSLNEMIAVKNDLRILQDREGKRLKEYHVEVENDELIVTDEEGIIFEYNPKSKESQRVQEALFHEKQTIIENCLFGVDINSNSAKICRLRLWIELLKNAYYKNETELETLPNIDINIKCGNSLISRFAIDADLGQALKKSKWTIDSYRLAVSTYRNAQNKEQKREMERLIADIKSDFRSEIASNDPKLKRLQKVKGELFTLTNQTTLFEKSKKEKEIWNKKVQKFSDEIRKLESDIEGIKNNKIYENAFEWRFEFPEVLNERGDFVGFDVVIGNPPYIRVQDLQHDQVDYYKLNFYVAHKRVDISILFIELGYKILSSNGILSYISSNQFLKAEYGRKTRLFLKGFLRVNVDYSKVSVFEGLATYVSVFIITKKQNDSLYYSLMEKADDIPTDFYTFTYKNLNDEPWDFNTNQSLKEKIFSNKKTLNDISYFTYGVITGLDKAFLVPLDEVYKLKLEKEITKKFIRPQNYSKYHIANQTFGLIYPYNSDNSIIQESDLIANYPNCFNFLLNYKTELENRKDSRTTIKEKGIIWYSIMRRVDLAEIDSDKIIFYDVGMLPNFMLDSEKLIFGGGTSHSLRITDNEFSNKFVLGLLNSKLMEWVIYDLCPVKMGNARKYGLDYIKRLPICEAERDMQMKISSIVEKIISKKEMNIDTTHLEKDIDNLVYTLYNLTEEEIEIIEKS